MFSETLKRTLKQEVVGQPYAIHSIVRGVTRLLSGMTACERSWCAYLFIGPPSTGRAYLVRSLARILHGDETVLTLSCKPGRQADPWQWFTQQLTPLVAKQEALPGARRRAPNLVLIEDLESAPREFYPMLARLLETGQLTLPDGRHGQLDNCMLFMTSGLCADEILHTRIGFSSVESFEDDEQLDAILKICRAEAEATFGSDLLTQLDSLVVFNRLEDEHLVGVLERHFVRMSRWLAQRGIQCTLQPDAKAFLMEIGNGQGVFGAHDLILAHRDQVEFPVADLLISGRLDAGSCVVIDRVRNDDHLHFTVEDRAEPTTDTSRARAVYEVPVA